jgi:hypothetical protein
VCSSDLAGRGARTQYRNLKFKGLQEHGSKRAKTNANEPETHKRQPREATDNRKP